MPSARSHLTLRREQQARADTVPLAPRSCSRPRSPADAGVVSGPGQATSSVAQFPPQTDARSSAAQGGGVAALRKDGKVNRYVTLERN